METIFRCCFPWWTIRCIVYNFNKACPSIDLYICYYARALLETLASLNSSTSNTKLLNVFVNWHVSWSNTIIWMNRSQSMPRKIDFIRNKSNIWITKVITSRRILVKHATTGLTVNRAVVTCLGDREVIITIPTVTKTTMIHVRITLTMPIHAN